MLVNGIINAQQKKKMGTLIHAAVKDAYDFYFKQRNLFDPSSDSFSNGRSLLADALPIYVIENESAELEIVSGFANQFFDSNRIDYTSCNVFRLPNDLTAQELSDIAWQHAISTTLNSIGQQGLKKFQYLLRYKCPRHLKLKYFGKNCISEYQIAMLTGMSRGGIAKQYNSEANNYYIQDPEITIAAELLSKLISSERGSQG